MKRFLLIGAVLVALQLMVHQTADAQTFSVENVSSDVGGGTPPGDDILKPSLAVGVPPGLVLPGLGIPTGGIGVEVDGFSYGRQFEFNEQSAVIEFSVDAFATGVGGSGVFIESSLGGSGEQNYDVYRTNLLTGGGTNVQIHDGNGVGPGGTVAPLGMSEPQSALPNPIHPGVDGYDTRSTPGRDIYWTWDKIGSFPPPLLGSGSGADVLISPSAPGYDGTGTVFAFSTALGLDAAGPNTDNIDALEVFDVGRIGMFDPGLDLILFSLDPGSPSLGLGGFTPGDILASSGGGVFGLSIPFGALGLTANDNVTALSVPEPNAALICWFGLGLAAAKRRRRV